MPLSFLRLISLPIHSCSVWGQRSLSSQTMGKIKHQNRALRIRRTFLLRCRREGFTPKHINDGTKNIDMLINYRPHRTNGTIEYTSVTADRLPEAMKVLREGFFPNENVCRALGLAANPEAIAECDQMLIDTARHGVSIVAIEKISGKIAGVSLNKLQEKTVSSKERLRQYIQKSKYPEVKGLFQLMAQLEDSMDPFTPNNANCLLELVFIGVLPEFSKRGIGYKLAEVSVQLATLLYRGQNVKTPLDDDLLPLEPRPEVVTALFTTFKSQNIGKKLKFEVQQLVSYDELFYDGIPYRKVLGNETEGITCECKRLN